ncbi:MAG: transcription termination/antitermination NusG family protein [Pseudomonadota bacterium]
MTWHVLLVRPGSEQKVHRQLTARGVDCRLPVETRAVRTNRGGERIPRTYPLLRGYLFAQIEPSHAVGATERVWFGDQWFDVRTSPIMALPGIRATMRHPEGRPVTLTEAQVQALEAMGQQTPEQPFAVGDRVEVIDGPLRGYTARIDHINEAGAALPLANMAPFTVPLKYLDKA